MTRRRTDITWNYSGYKCRKIIAESQFFFAMTLKILDQPSWNVIGRITIRFATLPVHISTRNSSNRSLSLLRPFWSPFQYGEYLFRVSYLCLSSDYLAWNLLQTEMHISRGNEYIVFAIIAKSGVRLNKST